MVFPREYDRKAEAYLENKERFICPVSLRHAEAL